MPSGSLGQGRLEAETQSWRTQALGWEPVMLSDLGVGLGGRVVNRTRMLPVALEAVWGHHQTVPIWIPCPSLGYLLLFPAPWMGQLIPACSEFKGKDVSGVRAPASCAPLPSGCRSPAPVCGASGDDGAARLWQNGRKEMSCLELLTLPQKCRGLKKQLPCIPGSDWNLNPADLKKVMVGQRSAQVTPGVYMSNRYLSRPS